MSYENENETIQIRFLTTDYDFCAARPDSDRPDLLSTQVIQRGKNPDLNYVGFYGCTHRASISAFLVKHSNFNPSTQYYFNLMGKRNAEERKNFPTTKITQNLQKALGIPCIAVSMLDDVISGECGSTYRMIEDYETSKRKISCHSIGSIAKLLRNYSSKNTQLLQVAQHAAKYVAQKYPDVSAVVTLDYLDDKLGLCESALEATKQPNWPANVKLNIFHHGIDNNIAPVTAAKPKQPTSLLNRFGLFAATSAAATGIATLGIAAAQTLYTRYFTPTVP